MSNAIELLDECFALGIDVTALNDGDLWVDPIDQLPVALRLRLVESKPQLIAQLRAVKRIHVHRVLSRLRDVGLYRDKGQLHVRRTATKTQGALIKSYYGELLDALRPRDYTAAELQQIALYAHDNGETSRSLLCELGRTQTDRQSLLWLAAGSPDYAEMYD